MRYPERDVGGYSRCDGTIEFYGRIRSLVLSMPAPPRVLDLGAGRGVQYLEASGYKRELLDLRQGAKALTAADPDSIVDQHPIADATVVIRDRRLPFDDGSFDLVVCDQVLEHVEDPGTFASEVSRVVASGGWFCARTPNAWGYIGVMGRLVPNRLHTVLAPRLQENRQPNDVFPAHYRLNTARAIASRFPSSEWDVVVYRNSPEPAYFAPLPWLERMLASVLPRLPTFTHAELLVFARRR